MPFPKGSPRHRYDVYDKVNSYRQICVRLVFRAPTFQKSKYVVAVGVIFQKGRKRIMNFKNKKLMVFGDSIMFGSGNGGKGVGEYLEKRYGFKLLKYAIGGARVGFQEGKSWVVEQVREVIKSGESADYIIFDGFTNDCNMTDGVHCDVELGEDGASTDIEKIDKSASFTECFESVCAAFSKYFAGANVLYVRPHRMGRRDSVEQVRYGERAVEICRRHGFKVADIYAEGELDTFDAAMRDKYTNDSYGWGRGDATHPNALGYEKFYLPVIEREIEKL